MFLFYIKHHPYNIWYKNKKVSDYPLEVEQLTPTLQLPPAAFAKDNGARTYYLHY